MAYFANDFRHLDDLYVSALDGSGQRQLTRLNAALVERTRSRRRGARALTRAPTDGTSMDSW